MITKKVPQKPSLPMHFNMILLKKYVIKINLNGFSPGSVHLEILLTICYINNSTIFYELTKAKKGMTYDLNFENY